MIACEFATRCLQVLADEFFKWNLSHAAKHYFTQALPVRLFFIFEARVEFVSKFAWEFELLTKRLLPRV